MKLVKNDKRIWYNPICHRPFVRECVKDIINDSWPFTTKVSIMETEDTQKKIESLFASGILQYSIFYFVNDIISDIIFKKFLKQFIQFHKRN